MKSSLRVSLVGVLTGCLTPMAHADISMTIDILGALDPGGPAPAGMVVVDVFVDVSPNDFFIAGAIFAETANGARLTYSASAPAFLPPGNESRFVTFGSAAYGRANAERFSPAGTLAEQTIAVVGAYIGPGTPTYLPNAIDVAFAPFPFVSNPGSPGVPQGRDGYVMRLAIDISAVSIPGGNDAANYRIFPTNAVPGGFQPILISDPPTSSGYGAAVASWYQRTPQGQNWGIFVPEPGTLASVVIGLVITFSRRTRRSEGSEL